MRRRQDFYLGAPDSEQGKNRELTGNCGPLIKSESQGITQVVDHLGHPLVLCGPSLFKVFLRTSFCFIESHCLSASQ